MREVEESTVCVQVHGTTVRAVYDVLDGDVLLASADFGDAQVALDGALPHRAAAALLHAMAEAAMASGGDPFPRDDHQPRFPLRGGPVPSPSKAEP